MRVGKPDFFGTAHSNKKGQTHTLRLALFLFVYCCLNIQQQQVRIFQKFLHPYEESHRSAAVDYAVVVG